MATSGLMQRSIIWSDRRRGQQSWSDGEVGLALPLTAEKGMSVILVLNQYKCIGCSPGKHPDTRTMATGSDDDSRDSVHTTGVYALLFGGLSACQGIRAAICLQRLLLRRRRLVWASAGAAPHSRRAMIMQPVWFFMVIGS